MKQLLLTLLILFTALPDISAQKLEEVYSDSVAGWRWPASRIPFLQVNNKLVFSAGDTSAGFEIWGTDGTTEGTRLLKDISPGKSDGIYFDYPNYVLFNDVAYFNANDRAHGEELWRTDGTIEGTYMLKDIYPGIYGSAPQGYSIFKNRLYFSAADSAHGKELWSTDGTDTGTYMLKDIWPGEESSNVGLDTTMATDDKMFFLAKDSTHGDELWITDGTEDGTKLVKDINPGNKWSYIDNISMYKNRLVFTAEDSVHGTEPWTSNGTDTGTYMLKDIGTSNAYISSMYSPIIYKDRIYFGGVSSDSTSGLWTSDGTDTGTYPITDMWVQKPFTEFAGKLVFGGSVGWDYMRPWITDGTKEGTIKLTEARFMNDGATPQFIITTNDKIYFPLIDDTHNNELWVSDGSTGGTHLVKDINPTGRSNPALPIAFDNKLYFIARDTTGRYQWPYYWQTDGTEDGTVKVFSVDTFNEFASSVIFNEHLYVAASSTQSSWKLLRLNTTTTSITEQTPDNSLLKVYPNPTNDVLYLETGINNQLTLTDLTGRIVMQQTARSKTEQMEIGTLAPGVYLLSDSQHRIAKVIKQ